MKRYKVKEELSYIRHQTYLFVVGIVVFFVVGFCGLPLALLYWLKTGQLPEWYKDLFRN
ncbi:MAG: hypothetical protein WA435_12145 [Gallionellaceae bacterium]